MKTTRARSQRAFQGRSPFPVLTPNKHKDENAASSSSEPNPLPLLQLHYGTHPRICHHAFKKSQGERKRCAAHSRPGHFITVLADDNHDIQPCTLLCTVVMKMILSHLVVDYQFKLADPTARSFMKFGKMRLPSPFTTIPVQKRAVSGNGDSNQAVYSEVVWAWWEDHRLKASRADRAACGSLAVEF